MNLFARLDRLDKLVQRIETLSMSSAKRSPPETIFSLIREISPKLEEPTWFAQFAAAIERTKTTEVRFAFSGPPQLGKTETALHGLAHLAQHCPDRVHGYVTYSIKRCREVSLVLIEILKRAGLEVWGTQQEIRYTGGGVIYLTSMDQGLTGQKITGLLLIDDPYKGGVEAERENYREIRELVWSLNLATRLHPGASAIAMATRWHPRDFYAARVEDGWDHLNIPALAEEDDPLGREIGEPLTALGSGPFARERDRAWFARQRKAVGELGWQQQYQGRPRIRGAGIFHQPGLYTSLPANGFRVAWGLDFAYTEKTRADWSAGVRLLRTETGDPEAPMFWFADLHRAQAKIEDWTPRIKRAIAGDPGARYGWRCANGPEREVGRMLRRAPHNLEALELYTPPGDKFVSATQLSIAWNGGRVLWPNFAEFPSGEKTAPALDRFYDFTGAKDGETDDDIDAAGTAHYMLPTIAAPKPGQARTPSHARRGSRV